MLQVQPVSNLRFGYWNLLVIWDLRFGISQVIPKSSDNTPGLGTYDSRLETPSIYDPSSPSPNRISIPWPGEVGP